MHTTTGRRDRELGVLAAALTALAAACVLATVVLDLANRGTAIPSGLRHTAWPDAASGFVLMLPGALLVRRLRRSPVAWLLLVGGLVFVVAAVAGAYAQWAIYTRDLRPPGASTALVVALRAGAATDLVLPLVLLVFPDGRLPSRRWRVPAVVSIASTALVLLVSMTIPLTEVRRIDASIPALFLRLHADPFSFALPGDTWTVLAHLLGPLSAVSLVVPLAAYVVRFRRADQVRRAQLRWLLLAALVGLAITIPVSVAEPPAAIADPVQVVALAGVGAAVLVAMTRHRLYDVDLLLGATLLYGVLLVLLVSLDLALAAVVGHALGGRHDVTASVLATAVVLSLYGPVRVRLSRLVTQVVRGRRGDRYGVVRDLALRLEASPGAGDLLQEVAGAVATAFRAPWVRVELDGGRGTTTVVEHGPATEVWQELPLRYRGRTVGRMLMAQPAGGLRGADRRLLDDLVRQAGVAAQAVALTEELSARREEIVNAREEDRRRLRRDLHDGLGPALGALTLNIETARLLLGTSPEEADRMLVRVTEDVAATLADVRRLVHDLRPPALDEVGLVGALQQQARRLTGTGAGPVIEVEGVVAAELPAAVEVAAYRIASEAMHNTVRHARATRCTVRVVTEPGRLVVEVHDDGVGLAADAVTGVGLVSLRERASELGGSCRVGDREGGGTLVRAELPVTSELAGVAP